MGKRPTEPDPHRDALDEGLRIAFGETMPGIRDADPVTVPDAALDRLVQETGLDDVARYDVLGEVGRGGMGVVLRAMDLELGREVALKVLRGDLETKTALQRFMAEARITGQLQHPSIVPVHDFGVTERGRAWMSMRLVEGSTLGEALAAREGVDTDRARFAGILERVARAVAFAHSRGVVHRDLKPSNVMLGRFGDVQVMDWGLAKVLDGGDEVSPLAAARPDAVRSQEGSVSGTLGYMAPEQARGEGERIDQRADVFALGAILCEVLIGRGPYAGIPREGLLEAVREPDLNRARAALEGSPPGLRDLALRCLARDPEDRPADAAEVADALAAWLAGEEARGRRAEVEAAEARAEARSERRLRRVVLGAATAVVVAVGAAAWAWRAADEERRERATRATEEVLSAEREAAAHADAARDAEGGAAVEALDRAAAAAGRAVALAATDSVAPPVRARVARLQGNLVRRATAVRERLEGERLRERLRRRVRDLAGPSTLTPRARTGDTAFRDAVAEAGIDLGASDATGRIAASPLKEELLDILSLWLAHTSDPEVRTRLDAVLAGADPGPWREKVRAASDEETVLRVCGDPAFLVEASAATCVLAVVRIRSHASVPRALPLLRRMRNAHPGDWTLNAVLLAFLATLERGVADDAFLTQSRILLALDPGNPDHHATVASACLSAGRLVEALDAADTSLLRHGTHAPLWVVRARILRALGRDDAADAAARRAFVLAPDLPIVRCHMGEIAVRRRDWEEAREHVMRALAAEEDAGDAAWLLLTVIESARGDLEAAYAAISEAVARAPQSPPYLRQLSRTAEASGRLRRARAATAAVVALRPDDFEARLRLALLQERSGDLQAARATLDDAVAMAGAAARHAGSATPAPGDGGGQVPDETPSRSGEVAAQRTRIDAALAARDRALGTFPATAPPPTPEAALPHLADLRTHGLHALLLETSLRVLDPAPPATGLPACRVAGLAAASAGLLAHRHRGEDPVGARAHRDTALRLLSAATDALEPRILDGTTDARSARRILLHWLQDEALLPLRDPTHFAAPPEDERAPWATLWDRVRLAADG